MKRTLLLLLSLNLSACFFGGKGGLGNFLKGSGSESSGGLDGEFDETAYVSSVGLLTHEGIFRNMSKVTGIPVTNQNVKDVYERVKNSLPQKYEIRYFGASNQKAINVLSAEFCNELVSDTAALATLVPSYSADGTLSAGERDSMIQELADKFWGQNISSSDKAAAVSDIQALMAEIQGGGEPEDDVFFSACTIALSSLPVISL